MKETQKIRERLAAFKARSAWGKGVKEIAECLLDKYEEIAQYREGTQLRCVVNQVNAYFSRYTASMKTHTPMQYVIVCHSSRT